MKCILLHFITINTMNLSEQIVANTTENTDTKILKKNINLCVYSCSI